MTKENEQLIGSLYRALKQGDKRARYRNKAGEAMLKLLYERSKDRGSIYPPGWDGREWGEE